MACGTPVVSTDCPSGPSEILDGGAYGALVPVADDAALAAAIAATMANPPDRARLQARAAMFDYRTAIARYAAVLLGETADQAARHDRLRRFAAACALPLPAMPSRCKIARHRAASIASGPEPLPCIKSSSA